MDRRPASASFRLTGSALDGRTIRLGYALENAGISRIDLEETLELPESLGRLSGAGHPAVARALRGLHLAAGTSYWKTSIPPSIVLEEGALSDDDAAFWTEVYTLGLGEFFFRNEIDPRGAVRFDGRSKDADPVEAPQAAGPALLLWGGGKDSAVSHRALRGSGERHELLTIGRPEWSWPARSAEVAGVPHHMVTRRIDPKLFELNAAGALNGHVPVNAFLAAAAWAIALLTGRSAVVASNESSACEGNTLWSGIDVNHQWSKSLEFERGFQGWTRRSVRGGPEYFSLVRPLTELAIVRAFAAHPEFFATVTSCNRNFLQSGPAASRWCLTCPKCVFVALMARPWLDDAAYHELLGGDPLSDPMNVDTLEELLGIARMKPFECVGTPEESIAAIHLARTAGRKLPHGTMTLFNRQVAARDLDPAAIAATALARSDLHALPARFLTVLDAYLARS